MSSERRGVLALWLIGIGAMVLIAMQNNRQGFPRNGPVDAPSVALCNQCISNDGVRADCNSKFVRLFPSMFKRECKPERWRGEPLKRINLNDNCQRYNMQPFMQRCGK